MLTIGSVMNNQADSAKIQAVIAARPGIGREVLRAIVGLLPQIEVAGIVGGGLSVLNLVQKNPPSLLIIDSGLPEDEMVALLTHIKQDQPQIRCLVLAETTRQQATFMALGADAAVLRSEPTERLTEALDNMGLW
jgi:DNA-binding NarL/FixJ family response regulator